MPDTIQEFGQILADKRKANIAGVEVDVSRIPARFSLEMIKLARKGKENITFEENLDIIVRICQRVRPEITTDFVLDNLDITEINKLAEFILEPLVEKMSSNKASAGDSEEKNP